MGVCCCKESKEQKLDEIIAKYKDTRGALIPVLHEAQEIYGYLPMGVQKRIAKALMSSGRRSWSCYFLHPVFIGTQGKVQDQCLYGNRMLR